MCVPYSEPKITPPEEKIKDILKNKSINKNNKTKLINHILSTKNEISKSEKEQKQENKNNDELFNYNNPTHSYNEGNNNNDSQSQYTDLEASDLENSTEDHYNRILEESFNDSVNKSNNIEFDTNFNDANG